MVTGVIVHMQHSTVSVSSFFFFSFFFALVSFFLLATALHTFGFEGQACERRKRVASAPLRKSCILAFPVSMA